MIEFLGQQQRVDRCNIVTRSAKIAMGGFCAAAILLAAGMAQAHASGTPVIIGPDPNLPTMPIGAGNLESPTGFDVAVEGRIPSRCELGNGADIDFGELTGGLSAVARLGLECNVPFDLNIRAAKGGLTHNTKPTGEGPFSGRLAYGMDIDVPVLAPAERVMSGRYESRQLLSGVTLSSVDAIAKGGAVLRIETQAPEGVGLLAGEYSESIVLTITPRM
ncbi:hypothetical protein [Brevundimonas sp.]|uniref:hypothetical protein n=1 Tax=Brevundimonas sp. TaxID=1871086 RepID=UPI002FC81491